MIGRAYVHLRTSTAWIWVVLLGSIGWMAWNEAAWQWAPGLATDLPGFPKLTLVLSIEASVAASMILVETAKQSLRMLHLLEAIHADMKARQPA